MISDDVAEGIMHNAGKILDEARAKGARSDPYAALRSRLGANLGKFGVCF